MSNYQMDLYSLTPTFLLKYKIERYSSLIWTERYSAAGDFQLVVPPTPQLVSILHPGSFLGMRGRREIMMVETLSFDSGLLTVGGSSLVKFLNQRIAWFENPDYAPHDPKNPDTNLFADYSTSNQTAGEFISDVVNKLVINPVHFNSPYDDIDLDWNRDQFSQLSLAHIDHVGDKKELTFAKGTALYDGITQLASEEHVGISLYLAAADFNTKDFVLRFATYHGRDLTSSQSTFETVRFTPKLESLNDPKEVRGNTEYKNVAYVFHKGKISLHYAKYTNSPPVGFNRRVLYVEAPDVAVSDAKLPGFLKAVANNAFREHIHTHTVDGQVLGDSPYKFPIDYYLGDIVEVEGNAGFIVKARISEYIRSQDQYGVKEYPTFEILAEDQTNYHSDQTFEPQVNDPVYAQSPQVNDPIYPGPDPIFTGDDPNPDPLLDNTDTVNDGLVAPAADAGLHDLTDWQVPEWEYNTDLGYYVHSGSVYVIGAVSAYGESYPGSDVLLTNIPPEYAPVNTITRRVLVDHVNSTYEYAYDSGLKIGPWLSVTITPEGTVTLDGGNPFRPRTNPSDYTYLSLFLSTISWPTSNAEYDAYGNSNSLDEWVGSAEHINAQFGNDVPEDIWQNIDGNYSAHDSRLHLSGQVQSIGDYGAYPYDALIGIPPEYQPKKSGESSIGGDDWCEVPQKDGYRFHIAPPSSGRTHALYSESGAQNPAAALNNGCGFNAPYFYERRSDGFLSRGSTPAMPTPFVPAPADVGVSFVGCSGSPIAPLPDIADWRGNVFSATVRFKPADLIDLGHPPDHTTIHGDTQLCFICGLVPGMSSYYKVVYGYDLAFNQLYAILLLEQCGGSGRALLGEEIWTPNPAADGTVGHSWTLRVSPNPSDVGYSGALSPGYNYWSFGGSHRGTDLVTVPLTGSTVPPGGKLKGDMGFHISASAPPTMQILQMNIEGIGSFPKYAPFDTIDFTGCGWPLY
jgi:hypothetical protein